MTSDDIKKFYKERGILICAFKKQDYASIGADFFLSKKDYIELKERMDVKENYKKSGRITFPNNQRQELEGALINLQRQQLGDEENTKIKVFKDPESGETHVEIDYEEIKPSRAELLDTVKKNVHLTINENEKGQCSIDFTHDSLNEHRKVKKILELVRKQVPEFDFDFTDIILENLPFEERINLFESFFVYNHDTWKLDEIIKLKVKRDVERIDNVADVELKGINSAVLSGEKLSENAFVRSTIKEGFYFCMARIRLNHESNPKFLEVIIDFKASNKSCEVSIANYGRYEEKDNCLKEIREMLKAEDQEKLLNYFKNTLYDIFMSINERNMAVDIQITANNDLEESEMLDIDDDDDDTVELEYSDDK